MRGDLAVDGDFFANGEPQPFEWMKNLLEWIAAAVQPTINFSEQMTQSVQTASHQSRMDDK